MIKIYENYFTFYHEKKKPKFYQARKINILCVSSYALMSEIQFFCDLKILLRKNYGEM